MKPAAPAPPRGGKRAVDRLPAVHTGPLLRVGSTVVAFLLGVYGFTVAFALEDPAHAHLADYAFKSLQLIVGQFPSTLDGKPLPITLNIARWALPVLAGWTSLELAWLRVRNRVRLKWIAMRGDHLIVAGDADLAWHVVEAERRAKRPVIVWTDDPKVRWVQEAADLGAPFALIHAGRQDFSELGLERARSLLVAGPDDGVNVALAAAAMDQARSLRAAGDPLNIIARVDDPDLRGPLEERFDKTGFDVGARLRFASLPDISSRELFLSSALDRFVRVNQPGRVVFALGFSPTVERFVTRLLAAGHFRDGVKPTVVVLDADAERKRDVYFSRRPGAASLAPVIFERAPIDQPSLISDGLAGAIERHGAPVLMVIDPPEASRALPLALAVANFFRKRGDIAPPIQVHMAADMGGSLDCALFAMGDIARLGSPELLLQEQIDGLARSIHDFYFEGQLAEGAQIGSRGSMYEWDLLPEAVRDDNRLVADCYQLKLRDVDARLIHGAGVGLKFEGAELEELAIAEHQRWMAAKVIDGWVYGEQRDDAAKRHPNIAPYDDLSDAIKDLDREQIRLMTRLVGRGGQRVVRDLVCAIEPGAWTDEGASKGLAAALTQLGQQYPDRAIVLSGAFEDAAVRKVLAAGLAAGGLIQITVARNPELTLDGLSHEDRDVAREVYRSADRIFALPDAQWSAEQRHDFLLRRAGARISGSGPGGQPGVTLGSGVGGGAAA